MCVHVRKCVYVCVCARVCVRVCARTYMCVRVSVLRVHVRPLLRAFMTGILRGPGRRRDQSRERCEI